MAWRRQYRKWLVCRRAGCWRAAKMTAENGVQYRRRRQRRGVAAEESGGVAFSTASVALMEREGAAAAKLMQAHAAAAAGAGMKTKNGGHGAIEQAWRQASAAAAA